MRILFAVSEVAPFSKTGGLGDVAAALPRALARRGHEVWVLSPRHRSVDPGRFHLEPAGQPRELSLSWGKEPLVFLEAPGEQGLRLLFVEHAGFFDRAGLYGEAGRDYPDNARRFAFFSRALLEAPRALGFKPDLVHVQDWQAALVPLFARGELPSVLTIHNLGYQGLFPKETMEELGLPEELYTPEGIEFYGQVNFLKAGLLFADRLTTVSERYAQEILTPEQGFGLDGVLRKRRHELVGIVNGIDVSEWNPAADPLLPATYSARNLQGKARCREQLLQIFGIPPEKQKGERAPVLGMVTRLVDQKGLDLVMEVLPQIMELGCTLVVLGTGDPRYESALRAARERHPKQLGVKIGFDNALAHLVEAGSDLFLMPSRYEPCGLNQMYSMRYGTPPLVRATGGLDDTVIDAGVDPERGTGFKFAAYTGASLLGALRRAVQAFRDPKGFAALQRRGMKLDFSWDRAAEKYEALFQSVVTR